MLESCFLMESDSDETMERFWELGENVLRKIGLTSVPYLIQNIASDELEDTSMKLLKEFGDPVISELIRAIEHREVVEDTRMLWRVLEVLGSFGPRAAAALPALCFLIMQHDSHCISNNVDGL